MRFDEDRADAIGQNGNDGDHYSTPEEEEAMRECERRLEDGRLADVVNHPAHYTQGGIECIDALKAATIGKTGIEAVCVANVIKYLWRYEEKNGAQDIEKAAWYLRRLLEEV